MACGTVDTIRKPRRDRIGAAGASVVVPGQLSVAIVANSCLTNHELCAAEDTSGWQYRALDAAPDQAQDCQQSACYRGPAHSSIVAGCTFSGPRANCLDSQRKRDTVRKKFISQNMHSKHDNSALNSAHVQRRFDRAAVSFDTVDFVHSATRDGLIARLEPMAIEANTIIDLGCATGSGARLLARHFRRARIVAVDLSHKMLAATRKKQSWFSRVSVAQANAEALPFADQSVDVIFANLLLPWIANPAQTFAEVARVLRKDGLFLFATLGPDSLAEIRQAWSNIDGGQHINRFLDMHNIGDAAVRAGLRDPVLDVDYLAVTYRSTDALFQDLTATGARNCLQHRERSLGAAARFRAMTDALDGTRQDDLLTLNLELVYGHCWGGGQRLADGEYRVAASGIRKRGD